MSGKLVRGVGCGGDILFAGFVPCLDFASSFTTPLFLTTPCAIYIKASSSDY